MTRQKSKVSNLSSVLRRRLNVVVWNMSSCMYFSLDLYHQTFYPPRYISGWNVNYEEGSNMLNIVLELGNQIRWSNIEHMPWLTRIHRHFWNIHTISNYFELQGALPLPQSFQFLMIMMNNFLMQYDTDGSGQIEFPEFCNMMSHKMNASDDKEAVRKNYRK